MQRGCQHFKNRFTAHPRRAPAVSTECEAVELVVRRCLCLVFPLPENVATAVDLRHCQCCLVLSSRCLVFSLPFLAEAVLSLADFQASLRTGDLLLHRKVSVDTARKGGLSCSKTVPKSSHTPARCTASPAQPNAPSPAPSSTTSP